MLRAQLLDLASRGHRVPIGADLVLHRQSDAESILCDGVRLGSVVEEAAWRFRTSLAFPIMDLRLEKAELLRFFGVPAGFAVIAAVSAWEHWRRRRTVA